uniref:IstB-like ATP-binding domain-containing protein n=1 Tax=uncultured Desulfobacterium sp. TaxID=201089 RepID=E1Y8Z4_9BACT|nr:hypothetical protein N47_A10670 [uncultured Desulfobacterium sp.]
MGKTIWPPPWGIRPVLKAIPCCLPLPLIPSNHLVPAQNSGRLKQELKKYLNPALVILDELGYLPIDKNGADLLFQIISQRYEQGSLVITTNRVFKEWPEIFNNDSTLTSALLDRLLHHTEAVVIEGKSYRMKEVAEK